MATYWIVLLALACSLVDLSNAKVGLHDGQVYILMQTKQNYDDATTNCEDNHGGVLANLANATELEISKTLHSQMTKWTEGIWMNDDDSNNLDDQKCPAITVFNATTELLDCATKLFAVCKVKGWNNVTMYGEHRYGFSNAKLRYVDGRSICEQKASEDGVTGSLAVIKSTEEQQFISGVVNYLKKEIDSGDTMSYYINTDNFNLKKTENFTNWQSGYPSDDITDKCIELSDEEAVSGEWKDVSCYDYKHFICKWTLYTPTTTGSLIEETSSITELGTLAETTMGKKMTTDSNLSTNSATGSEMGTTDGVNEVNATDSSSGKGSGISSNQLLSTTKALIAAAGIILTRILYVQ